jgi:uncharacterized phiE125 gp8 family phage protein
LPQAVHRLSQQCGRFSSDDMIAGDHSMQRIVVQPAGIGEAGLADLRPWLGISQNTEDALLAGLLSTALDVCEAFTGQVPLMQTIEELLPPEYGLCTLASRPVREVVAVELVHADNSRTALTASDYTARINACGSADFRLMNPAQGRTLAVHLSVGIAADWASLPPALKHGVIRLAAHYYRDRDTGSQRTAAPPASVAALWQPWRAMRLV